MLTWSPADTVGTAINLIANVREHVHRVIEMPKDEKQFMAAHSNSCRSNDVYHHKDFGYEYLACAVRYAEIDAERPRLVRVD